MTKSKSTRISSTEAKMRQMIRSHDFATRELKMQTILVSGTNSTAGSIGSITTWDQQGDNVSNRTGYVINVHSLKVSAQCSMNASAGVDRWRVIVLYDRLNTGTAPVVADVLDTASVVSDYAYFAQTQNRFKILHDKVYTQSINGDSRAINFERLWRFKHPVPVSCLGTTTNWGKNAFFFLIISDTPTNLSTYAISTTIRYFDD